jgi:hypothetical protein
MLRSVRTRVGLAILALFALLSAPLGSEAALPSTEFREGWYDALAHINNPPGIAADGMQMIHAYYGYGSQPAKYLAAASAAGTTVMAELPRSLVKAMDIERIKTFVSLYKDKPALEGWSIADEPSLNTEVGPLTAQNAITIYNAIKSVDPVHPVSITFASGEDPLPYLPALDILQHDDYPAVAGTPEFTNLDRWKHFTFFMGYHALQNNKRFFPVLQAFGGTDTAPVLGYRAPTPAEMRYMVFSSVAALADSLFFWTYYRRDPNWVTSTLAPLLAELRPMHPAFTAGPRYGVVSSSHESITATAFQDPTSARWYIVAVNHTPEAAAGTLNFSGELSGKTTAYWGQGTPAPIVADTLAHSLEPYEARVYTID